jgi:hypothetical protein
VRAVAATYPPRAVARKQFKIETYAIKEAHPVPYAEDHVIGKSALGASVDQREKEVLRSNQGTSGAYETN